MAKSTSRGKKKITSADGKISIPVSSTEIKMTVPIDGEDRLKINNQGLKLSQEGVDVSSANDKQSIVNSTNNSFKIVASSSATVSLPTTIAASTTYSATIAHGLASTPAFMAFVTLPSSWLVFLPGESGIQQTPYRLWTSIGTNDQPIVAKVSADSTNIYFMVVNQQPNNMGSLDGNMVFRYYILQETAN